MSLPDTIFIFVLALIIFGPKKLPEIGRQLGKLVGEFRRASNEFKFQIEEELRQVELSDRNTIAPPSKELGSSASASSSSDESPSPLPDQPYPEETLPVGQYPNIDTVNPQELNAQNPNPADPETAEHMEDDQVVVDNAPVSPSVTPAAGTEPRTAHPYAAAAPVAAAPEGPFPSSVDATPDLESNPNHEPADPHAAPAVADVAHG